MSEAGQGAAQSSSQRQRRRGMIEHTLAEISSALERSFFAEEIARRPGLLQSLDPRTKVVSLLLFLVAVSLSRSLGVIAALYLGSLAVAWASAVPMGFFIKRVWLFMPFFTGIVAIPALFMTPGPPLATLPLGLVVTTTGAGTAAFLLLRVSTSVSSTVLLVLTTPWNSLLKALGVLRIPDVFILVLGMTFRYIYLFLEVSNDMFLARKSRVLGKLSGAEQRRLVAASAGALLSRSVDLSGEVYLAMQSRGFRGYPRTMDAERMRPGNWVWAGGMLLVTAAAIWLGR
jgi:cobalt/nickel transport system permease protein